MKEAVRAGVDPCASSPWELIAPWWTSAPWVVGFEVQPAESPDPLLPSQVFQVWWLQFDGVTVHNLSILRGVIPCRAGLYATFTGFCGVSQEAPLPELLLYFEMFQPPKEDKL